ncbi:hypothetical protein SPBR_04699 [Sporothrix brasiliensis 5110]|uniref:Uncharacterized protein n=1 Tax=Sporothrix brasiliensis 5110 TaxID=1398154 RepID=A0A0C2F8T3_9PEZI|nr:uncharacterized protein SPBR_04699 [Sporothrix brasiliensis 5110]KIH87478.1 hypothetical protein SPBR_04699 [Sporothrix brasiliensis 5110]
MTCRFIVISWATVRPLPARSKHACACPRYHHARPMCCFMRIGQRLVQQRRRLGMACLERPRQGEAQERAGGAELALGDQEPRDGADGLPQQHMVAAAQAGLEGVQQQGDGTQAAAGAGVQGGAGQGDLQQHVQVADALVVGGLEAVEGVAGGDQGAAAAGVMTRPPKNASAGTIRIVAGRRVAAVAAVAGPPGKGGDVEEGDLGGQVRVHLRRPLGLAVDAGGRARRVAGRGQAAQQQVLGLVELVRAHGPERGHVGQDVAHHALRLERRQPLGVQLVQHCLGVGKLAALGVLQGEARGDAHGVVKGHAVVARAHKGAAVHDGQGPVAHAVPEEHARARQLALERGLAVLDDAAAGLVQARLGEEGRAAVADGDTRLEQRGQRVVAVELGGVGVVADVGQHLAAVGGLAGQALQLVRADVARQHAGVHVEPQQREAQRVVVAGLAAGVHGVEHAQQVVGVLAKVALDDALVHGADVVAEGGADALARHEVKVAVQLVVGRVDVAHAPGVEQPVEGGLGRDGRGAPDHRVGGVPQDRRGPEADALALNQHRDQLLRLVVARRHGRVLEHAVKHDARHGVRARGAPVGLALRQDGVKQQVVDAKVVRPQDLEVGPRRVAVAHKVLPQRAAVRKRQLLELAARLVDHEADGRAAVQQQQIVRRVLDAQVAVGPQLRVGGRNVHGQLLKKSPQVVQRRQPQPEPRDQVVPERRAQRHVGARRGKRNKTALQGRPQAVEVAEQVDAQKGTLPACKIALPLVGGPGVGVGDVAGDELEDKVVVLVADGLAAVHVDQRQQGNPPGRYEATHRGQLAVDEN